MANAMPWSVRGIDPDIREQAVEAAHRSGMSVGQWLNQVLAGNLDDEDDFDDAPRSAARSPRRKGGRIDELNERLARLGQRGTMTAAHRLADPERDDSNVLDLIERTVQAVERLDRDKGRSAPPQRDQFAEALRSFEQKLESLTQAAQSHGRVAAPAFSPAQDPRIETLLAALNRAPANERPAAQPARGFADEDPAFSRTLAEIEARRRNLDVAPGAMVTPSAAAAPAAQPEAETHIDAMRQQLDLLVTRIDEMRSEQRPETSRLQDRLAELSSRIEEWREQPQDAITALRRDLAQISAAIGELSPQRLVGLVEDAVARMADKAAHSAGDRLPEKLAEPLERMHEDVRAVLRELANSRSSDRLTQEVGNISRRLDMLSEAADPGRLDELARETGAIKALVNQAMRSQPLEGLARQIEAIAGQLDKFQRAPLPGDDRQILSAIREVSDRLERIDPAATFAGIETRLAAIGTIETKLVEIAQGMKKLAKEAQPLPQLETIAERLERIDRVLESAEGKPLAGLDALTGRLEKIGSSLDRVAESQPREGQDALVAMLERLSARMDDLQGAKPDSAVLDAVQDEIAGLARRMEAVAANPAGLDGIERKVSDLFGQFDLTRQDMRQDMRDLAEVAASKAAQEAIRNAPRDEAGETLAAEGLLLIKRDLNEFKTAQTEAEKRTRNTLEALHSTLETLVGRLSDIETSARTVRVEPPPAPIIPSRAEAGKPAPAPIVTPRAAPEARVTPETRAMPDIKAMPETTPAPAAGPDISDLPLEPGMQPGEATPQPESLDPRTNFIAAARRAAQVASEKSQAALAEDKHAKGGRGGASFITRARKPILLGLAALVFSLGALKVLSTRDAPAPVPASKPATSQPPIPLQKEEPPLPPENSGAADSPKDGPQTTGSTRRNAAGDETQPLPGADGAKRSQRLSDTSAHTQTDPLTAGSVGADGGRPIETGKMALSQLMAVSNLKGQERLGEAALAGRPEAIFEIGARFADGRGVARDAKLAARWFEQAAASGHAPSQYRLASLYREGKGIPKDSGLAFQWFDRAAAQGHVLAMHNAAVLLAEGVHGTPDYAGAALWFKRAAEHGVKDSQFNIAILFARGLGVNQDLAESYHWFAVAAFQGDQDAVKKRDDIAARLTKEQLAKAVARAKAFKPNKPIPAANEAGAWERPAKRGA